MAEIEHWVKYMNLLHELALVEDDLRYVAQSEGYACDAAERILFERFGV